MIIWIEFHRLGDVMVYNVHSKYISVRLILTVMLSWTSIILMYAGENVYPKLNFLNDRVKIER